MLLNYEIFYMKYRTKLKEINDYFYHVKMFTNEKILRMNAAAYFCC